MPSVHEKLTARFYEWERRGRGWQVYPDPVSPEPPFRPFYDWEPRNSAVIDDGKVPTFLGSLVERLSGKLRTAPQSPPKLVEPEDEPEPRSLLRYPLVEIATSLGPNLNIARDVFEQFLLNLSLCREPIAFELLGLHEQIILQFAVHPDDEPLTKRQLKAHFPEALFQEKKGRLEAAWEGSAHEDALVVEFGLEREFMLPLSTGKLDPFVGIVGALSELQEGEVGLFQVLFEPTREPWAENIVRSVSHADGTPFFVNTPELTHAAKNKVTRPLFAAVVRIAVLSEASDRTLQIACDLSGSLRAFSHPQGNELIPLSNDDYPFEEHIEDMLRRQSRRSGMILTSDELISFVHLPSPSVRTPKLNRDSLKTKGAPKIALNVSGILFGENRHAGKTTEIRLTSDQRNRHAFVIGASGTGKSTFLFNLIRQDIENGQGVALLDPHGDLVDAICGIIPPHRMRDVVFVNPADEEFSIGFNILSAHSDLEKNLLASDLVSVFERLSTSWGDQMGSVFRNAILAFLESSAGGTLADLRRFLIEPDYRSKFLETVNDPDIVYYWKKAFPLLAGNKSVGSVLTRLDAFLGPKPIRYMVTQKENRLDFGEIMNSGKIFLAKLSQGEMGEENSYLMGSFLVAKFHQAAISRAILAESARRNFWLYIDEFHNFMTPSLAKILSGARKYHIGLILAHQELRQLQRNSDVASAVLSQPYSRVCFRVGDEDARKLGDGFAFFEARDLQSLPNFEAICRVERADFDFNLHTSVTSKPDEAQAAETRNAVITASRNKYGVSREKIEGDIRKAQGSEAIHSKAREVKSVPTEKTSKNVPPVIKSPVEPSVPSAAAPKPEPAPRLIHPHQALKERIAEEARSLGFTVRFEKSILSGEGKIDVALERGDEAIACELSFTTPTENEVTHVERCLKAGYTNIAVVCTDPKRLKTIRTAVIEALRADDLRFIHFYVPDDFISSLKDIALRAPTKGTPQATKQPTYFSRDFNAEEQKTRERSMLNTLRENMKKGGGGS